MNRLRALLAAVSASRELADRAPPLAASLDTSNTAALSAYRHPDAAEAEA